MRSAGLTHSNLYRDAVYKRSGGTQSFALYRRKTSRRGRGLAGNLVKSLLTLGKQTTVAMAKRAMPLAKKTAIKAATKMILSRKKPKTAIMEAAQETVRSAIKKNAKKGKKKKKKKPAKKIKKKSLTPFEAQFT